MVIKKVSILTLCLVLLTSLNSQAMRIMRIFNNTGTDLTIREYPEKGIIKNNDREVVDITLKKPDWKGHDSYLHLVPSKEYNEGKKPGPLVRLVSRFVGEKNITNLDIWYTTGPSYTILLANTKEQFLKYLPPLCSQLPTVDVILYKDSAKVDSIYSCGIAYNGSWLGDADLREKAHQFDKSNH
jgi:hypothetical protein